MSKVDTTGFDAVLAAIPKGQLSERQQRIAAGMAMVREGSSVLAAAKACGLPNSTLWAYCNDVTKLGRENDGPLGRDIEALRAASVDASLIAAEKLRKALIEDEWKHGDLVKAYGVATDKVIAMGDNRGAAPNALADVLGALLDKGDVSIKRRDPANDAIEIEASPE